MLTFIYHEVIHFDIHGMDIYGPLFSQELRHVKQKFPKMDTLVINTGECTNAFISGSDSKLMKIELKYVTKTDEKSEVK